MKKSKLLALLDRLEMTRDCLVYIELHNHFIRNKCLETINNPTN